MKRLFSIIVIVLLFSTACGNGVDSGDAAETAVLDALSSEEMADSAVQAEESAETQPKTEQAAPEPGGLIKLACRTPKTFNPILNEDLTVDKVLRLIYEPLIALDESMKPFPAIASSWSFSADGMTLTLNLREQAAWADGTAITANDILFTFNAIQNSPATALYRHCLENISGYTAPNAHTVQITYTKAFAGALYQLTMPVIPAHYFGGEGANGYWPLGSGQYKLAEYNRMEDLVFAASENSYRGLPQIPRVQALIVREMDSAYYAYEQQLIDLIDTGRDEWKTIAATRSGKQIRYPSTGYEFLAFNFKNPLLQNVSVRKAIAYALDKETIAERCYDGNAAVTYTPVNPYSWLYVPGTNFIEYDMGFAAAMLEESGVTAVDNPVFTVLVNNDNPARMEAARLLQQELAKIGIQANIVTDASFETYLKRLQSGDFDIAFCGVDMTIAPDLVPVLGSGGGYNFGTYNSGVMDQYLSQANASVFEPSMQAAYTNIQKQFNQDLPHISIAYRTNTLLLGSNVYGEAHPVINNPYGNLGDLRIIH